MGCKKKVVGFAKHVWRLLGPVVIRNITDLVQSLDKVIAENPGILTNHNARAIVIQSAKDAWKREYQDMVLEGRKVTEGELERAIRVALEKSLHDLRAGATTDEILDTSDEKQPISV